MRPLQRSRTVITRAVCTAHGFIDSASEVIRMGYASVKRTRIVVCGFVFCLALVVVAWAQANEPLDL